MIGVSICLPMDVLSFSFVCWIISFLVSPSEQTAVFNPSLFAPQSETSCPPDAQRQVMLCASKLPNEMVRTPGLGQVPLSQRLRDGCEQGHFSDALNCIERVMLDCRRDQTDDAHFLRSSFDMDSSRKTIAYFCDNLDTFISSMDCMLGSHASMVECARDSKTRFAAQVQATDNMDALMRFQCPLYKSLITCVRDVLAERCGRQVSDVNYNVMAGFEPPICRKTKYSISADRQQQDQGVIGSGSAGSGSRSFVSDHVLIVFALIVFILRFGEKV